MRYFYASVLLICCGLAFFYASRIFYNKSYLKVNHRIFTVASIFSGLCSLGYGMRYATSIESTFYFWRIVGSFSMFIFLYLSQLLMDYVFKGERWFKFIILCEILIGAVVLPLYNNPNNSTLEMTATGYITHTKISAISIAFSVYSIYVVLTFVCVSVHMIITQKKNRNKAYALFFLIVELIVSFGFIFDTIMPAISGSSKNIQACAFFQFVGLDIMYHAINHIDNNEINMQNMTKYISQVLKVPVFVFDETHTIKIKNNATDSILYFKDDNYSKINFWNDIFNLPAPSFDNKSTETISLTAKCATNNQDYQLFIDPIYDDYKDYLGYIVVANDITENVRNMNETIAAKSEAERLKEEAIRANATKSSFLANMSHEIRTPMNSILGFSSLALEDKIDDISREYFLDIKQSAGSLLSIINDILDIEKIEAGKMTLVEEEYRPYSVLHEVCSIIQIQANNKGLDFYADIDSSIPDKLYGDKVKLRQILINLLNNGVKYTPSGSVTLSIKAVNPTAENVTLEIKVMDTGIGIKEEELDSVFEMFTRVDEKTNSSTEGSGLGLSITKGMVSLMGGFLGLESEYGKGSTFTVSLSQKVIDASPMNEELDREEKRGSQLSLSDVHILAVDDNLTNLKVIQRIMRKYGCEVTAVDSGKKAIEACDENDYDLIFMDQMMPVMDGVTAMNMIRKLGGAFAPNGSCKIIALTANAINGVRDELILMGFDDYLMKPIDFKELERVLTQLLPKEKYNLVSVDSEADESPIQKTVQNHEPVSVAEPAAPMEKPSLINLEAGLENFGGELEDLKEILSFVCETGEADLAELQSYFDRNDIENFTIKVHGMKSQCNYIGALSTGEKARLLEFAGKEGNNDYITKYLSAFKDMYRAFIEEGNKLLQSK